MVLTQSHRHSLEDPDKELPGTPPPACALFLHPVIFHQLFTRASFAHFFPHTDNSLPLTF